MDGEGASSLRSMEQSKAVDPDECLVELRKREAFGLTHLPVPYASIQHNQATIMAHTLPDVTNRDHGHE